MGQVQVNLTYSLALNDDCKGFSKWPVFLFSSIISWIGGLFLIFLWRFIWTIFFSDSSVALQKRIFGQAFFFNENNTIIKYEFGWTLYIKKLANTIESPANTIGKFIWLIHYISNLIVVAIYIYRASYL